MVVDPVNLVHRVFVARPVRTPRRRGAVALATGKAFACVLVVQLLSRPRDIVAVHARSLIGITDNVGGCRVTAAALSARRYLRRRVAGLAAVGGCRVQRAQVTCMAARPGAQSRHDVHALDASVTGGRRLPHRVTIHAQLGRREPGRQRVAVVASGRLARARRTRVLIGKHHQVAILAGRDFVRRVRGGQTGMGRCVAAGALLACGHRRRRVADLAAIRRTTVDDAEVGGMAPAIGTGGGGIVGTVDRLMARRSHPARLVAVGA